MLQGYDFGGSVEGRKKVVDLKSRVVPFAAKKKITFKKHKKLSDDERKKLAPQIKDVLLETT